MREKIAKKLCELNWKNSKEQWKRHQLYYLERADAILSLLKEEIEKSLWTREDARREPHLTGNDCLRLYDEEGLLGLVDRVRDITAQAQLDNTLKIVEEK